MINVLVTAAGTGTAFSYITRLKKNWFDNVKVHVCDINSKDLVTSSLFADTYSIVPLATDDGYMDALLSIIKYHGVDVIMPILNHDFQKLAEAQRNGLLPDRVKFFFPLSKVAAVSNNKEYAGFILSKLGVNVPKEYRSFDDLPEVFFSKPKNGFGSRGAKLIKKTDFSPELFTIDDIYQELLSGPEVTVDCFHDQSTGFTHVTCRERLEIKNGVCTKARIFHDDKLLSIGTMIAQEIEFNGGFCFQVMKAGDEWVVIDVNMRLGAGSALSAAVGNDYFSATIAKYLGEDYQCFLLSRDKTAIVTRQYSEFVMSRG